MMTQREMLQDLRNELSGVEQEQNAYEHYNSRVCWLEHRQRVLEHKIAELEAAI